MRLFNTLTRSKEEFMPQLFDRVAMYSCGPTVYDYFHIGNARPFIVFDVLRRYLEYKGYIVNFVQNFTDIDDKMIKRANEDGTSVKELAEKYIHEYFHDADNLNIKRASIHPRATENIHDIIEFIKILIDKGYAYNVQGDVYFSTKMFKNYGKLSSQPLDELMIGARINPNKNKKDMLDFTLWKKEKSGEPSWESPWGKGRPGWHIECSVMVNKYLGPTVDIHSGGCDLIFPHHENEIAQSETANGVTFAKYWLHNGHINVNYEKMSKSKGNFFTVRELSDEFGYEPIRFFMLSSHYRNPINFSEDLIASSCVALSKIYNCVSRLEFIIKSETKCLDNGLFREKADEFKDKFIKAMEDDLNTAGGIGAIFDMINFANKFSEKTGKDDMSYFVEIIKELCAILGLETMKKQKDLPEKVAELLKERKNARDKKDWVSSDQIREKLKNMGILIEDTPHGQKITTI